MDYKHKYLKYKNKYLKLIQKSNNIKRAKLTKIFNQQEGGALAGENNPFLERFRQLIICPISQTVMVDPVMTSDGQTYDRENIERWLVDHTTSPITGAELDYYGAEPNIALKNVIEYIINQGLLDLQVIQEYLENLGLNQEQQNQRILDIIRKKVENSGQNIFQIPEGYPQIFVNGISLKYTYVVASNKYKKEITIELSNGNLIRINKLEGNESTVENLGPGSIVPHVRPQSLEHFQDIIIFDQDNLNSIKKILERNLLAEDFYKLIKDSKIASVIISPRIKYNPVFYTFMNYDNCMIMNEINNRLAIRPILEIPDLYQGLEEQIFSIKGIYQDLLTAPLDRESELARPSIMELNQRIGNTRYSLCGVEIENIPYIGKEIVSLNGESWTKIVADEGSAWRLENGRIAKKRTQYEKWVIKEKYVIAFTGANGIGKSYLTHACIKPDLIFETDNCTKDTFLATYTESGNRPVIVVGLRDPTFNLDYIKTQLLIPAYECKIVNISERFNEEEDQRLERIRLEEERLQQEALIREQQAQERRVRELRQQGVFVVGFNREQIPTVANPDGGPVEGFNYIYRLYLSDNNLITLRQDFGECGSGWTTATWASMEIRRYNQAINQIDRLAQPIRYLGVNTRNDEYYDNSEIHELNFDGNKSIIVDEIGGDGYYPSGSVMLNNFP